ncbi:MAG: CoA ester lyase, partial [Acidimicrobiales bacterium]
VPKINSAADVAAVEAALEAAGAPDHTRIWAMLETPIAVLLNGKMEDDASVKQCQVIIALARQLADRDPELAQLYGF